MIPFQQIHTHDEFTVYATTGNTLTLYSRAQQYANCAIAAIQFKSSITTTISQNAQLFIGSIESESEFELVITNFLDTVYILFDVIKLHDKQRRPVNHINELKPGESHTIWYDQHDGTLLNLKSIPSYALSVIPHHAHKYGDIFKETYWKAGNVIVTKPVPIMHLPSPSAPPHLRSPKQSQITKIFKTIIGKRGCYSPIKKQKQIQKYYDPINMCTRCDLHFAIVPNLIITHKNLIDEAKKEIKICMYKRLGNFDEYIYDHKECVICFDKVANCILCNCGHKCVCCECADDLKVCPLCKHQICGKLKEDVNID